MNEYERINKLMRLLRMQQGVDEIMYVKTASTMFGLGIHNCLPG